MQANLSTWDWGVRIGGALMFAPVLGFLCTVAGMTYSFHQLDGSGIRDPSGLQAGIGFTLWGTAAGLLLALPGTALFVVSIILRQRARNTPPHLLPPMA